MPKSTKPERPASVDGRRADPAINNYAQWRVEQWLHDNPDKLPTNLAEAFGLTDYAVSKLRNKGEGVGWGLARQLARGFGMTLSEFVAEADRFWEEQQAQPANANGTAALNERPEWSIALASAIAKHGINRRDAEAVGEWHAHLSGKLTAETLAALVAASKGATIPAKPPRRR